MASALPPNALRRARLGRQRCSTICTKPNNTFGLSLNSGFLAVLSVILIYLILGANSGVFVSGVAENVVKFASAIPEQSLIGIAIVLALVFLIARRVR